NFVCKDIFGDQAKEIAGSVAAAEAVFIIRQDLGAMNEKVMDIDNLARFLITNEEDRKPPDEKTRVVRKRAPTMKRKERKENTLYEFAIRDLEFLEQQRRISVVTLDNIVRLMKSFTDPKLEEQVSSVRAELERYD